MSVVISNIKRVFKFKGEELPDPDPTWSTNEVLDFFAGKYPELTAGYVKEPEQSGDKMVYEIGFSVGDKA